MTKVGSNDKEMEIKKVKMRTCSQEVEEAEDEYKNSGEVSATRTRLDKMDADVKVVAADGNAENGIQDKESKMTSKVTERRSLTNLTCFDCFVFPLNYKHRIDCSIN